MRYRKPRIRRVADTILLIIATVVGASALFLSGYWIGVSQPDPVGKELRQGSSRITLDTLGTIYEQGYITLSDGTEVHGPVKIEGNTYTIEGAK